MIITRNNGYTAFMVAIILYLIILTLFLIWVSGCGDEKIIAPEVVFPDRFVVSEIQPQLGAKLAWTTELWRLGKLRDSNNPDVIIIDHYRLWLLIKLENIGDRKAINIKPSLKVKTWYGNTAKVTILERVMDDELSPKEGFYVTINSIIETKDNIWDADVWLGVDDIGKAGIIPRVEFTWDTI